MDEDIVRVLRLIDYTGPRSLVEEQIKKSIHGTRVVLDGRVTITTVTLDQFPRVMEDARAKKAPSLSEMGPGEQPSKMHITIPATPGKDK